MKAEKKKIWSSVFLILSSFLIINILFALLYQLDNKYTADVPRSSDGMILITTSDLKNHSVIPLVDGWEYYSGKLYTPDQLREGTTDTPKNIFLGQFGNFSEGDLVRSPFGRTTYRLHIQTSSSLPTLSLECPEIFSASKIWVNGELVVQNGQVYPQSYQPHVQNRILSIPSGETELVIQVENYSHYYSGMTYPPLLGTTDGLAHVLLSRILFYSFMAFFSLGAAAASCFLWLSRKKPLYLAYGLLAVFFALRVSYPFFHGFGIGIRMPYILEDTSYFAGIVCMAVITHQLCGRAIPFLFHQCMLGLTIFLCMIPIVSLLLIFPLIPQMVTVYGVLINVGKGVLSLYLMFAAARGCIQRETSPWLLAGNAVFSAGILTDILTANRFEPIRFGWQDEYSGFIMVLLFTILMAGYGRQLIRKNKHLTANLQQEVEEKTRHLSALLDERKRFLSSVAHDLKAPVAVIQMYTNYIRQENIAVDLEVQDYLELIDQKSSQLENSLAGLQLFSLESYASENLSVVEINVLLSDAYRDTKPYADANGIYYHLQLPKETGYIRCQPQRLYRALENILLNATEYTPPAGIITLTLRYDENQIVVIVSDTGCGISSNDLPHIFDYRFSTHNGASTAEEVRGLGLYFTRITLEELGGCITAASAPGDGAVFTLYIPKYSCGSHSS